jgi:hypothetical protein
MAVKFPWNVLFCRTNILFYIVYCFAYQCYLLIITVMYNSSDDILFVIKMSNTTVAHLTGCNVQLVLFLWQKIYFIHEKKGAARCKKTVDMVSC